jgi:hypothetical protein
MKACPFVSPLAWSGWFSLPQWNGRSRAGVTTNNYPLGSPRQCDWQPGAQGWLAASYQASVGRLGAANNCPLACPLAWPPDPAQSLSLLLPLPTNVGVYWQPVSCPVGGGI